MSFSPTFELVRQGSREHTRLRALSINFQTGEKFIRIGSLDGEDQDSADIFAYTDGARVIPFIFGDYRDFGLIGEARGYRVPITSAFVTWVGNDLRALKSHTYSRMIYYDRTLFESAERHGYAFSDQNEYEAFVELLRRFLPAWLFAQLQPQTSKASIRTFIRRTYHPCVCVEVLAPKTPWNLEEQWGKIIRQRHYVRWLSKYRGPHEELDELLLRRRAQIPTGQLVHPAGQENKSPWGGARVRAIEKDCEATIARATEAAQAMVNELVADRTDRIEAFLATVERIQTPHRLEKLIHALLNCETAPTDKIFHPLGCTWAKSYLWHDAVQDLLASIACAEANEHVVAKDQLVVLIAECLSRRALEKGNRLEEKVPAKSQRLVNP